MSHLARMLTIGLALAMLAGYFIHWLWVYEWFRPISGMVGIVIILALVRWLVGKWD